MRKYRADDFWFELTEGPAPDGVGFVRYNRVTCRKCHIFMQVRNTGQSNDQLRKLFLRSNWYIGRARNLHLCPKHAEKMRERTPDIIPLHPSPPSEVSNVIELRPPPINPLIALWEQSSQQQREELLIMLEANRWLQPPPPPPPPLPIIEEQEPKPDVEPPSEPELYQVVEPGLTPLDWNETITTHELSAAQEKYGADAFTVKPIQFTQPAAEAAGSDAPVVNNDDDDEPAEWWKQIHKSK